MGRGRNLPEACRSEVTEPNLSPKTLVLDRARGLGEEAERHGVRGATGKGSSSASMLWEISDAHGKQKIRTT